MHRLAGVRNVVAHDGHDPTSEETEHAVQVATELVREVALPMPGT